MGQFFKVVCIHMEMILLIGAFVLLLVGLIGSIVPALPGPPFSYAGLLLLQWSGYGDFTLVFLLVWGAITVAVTVMDNILPALLTKKFGGSRLAVIGSVVGLVIGIIFFAPIGIILGPFMGALAGELLNNQYQIKRNEADDESDDGDSRSARNIKALTVALGAFLAFIVGTGAKLIVCTLMIYYAIRAVL
jgi:uncharacterized protein YqgC (DUF456 family)